MTLIEAVNEYVAKRDAFEAKKAAYEDWRDVRLPLARAAMNNADGAQQTSKNNLNKALTPEALEVARTALDTAESNFKSANLLYNNLNLSIKAFEDNRSTAEWDIRYALKQVWNIKRRELMEAFSFDEATLTALEMIITAGDAPDPGMVSNIFGHVINEKYGALKDKERLAELRQQMETELGI
jgi:hypothetical protein